MRQAVVRMCDPACEGELRSEISSLANQLNVYKPLLLALVTTMFCISVWLLALTLTGKRRDKLRRLLRRDRFISELESGSSQEVDSQGDSRAGEERSDVTSTTVVAMAAPPVPPVTSTTSTLRSTKISLPARMTDLYQTYPGDSEGMVVAQTPEIVLTRPSISSAAPDTADEKQSEREMNTS